MNIIKIMAFGVYVKSQDFVLSIPQLISANRLNFQTFSKKDSKPGLKVILEHIPRKNTPSSG